MVFALGPALLCALLPLFLCPANAFLYDKEVEIVRTEWSPVVVVVRHVEYMGVADNGTLKCSVPGFTKYRWTILNKASKEGYAESVVMGTDEDLPESQSDLEIGGEEGIPLVNDLMVVSCEAMVELEPRMRMVWVITRMHSPLGYPTDPSVCDYGSNSYLTNCTWYQWTYRTDCYHGKGLEYRGTQSRALKGNTCKYWHMSGGAHPNSHKLARVMGFYSKGGHDYCRNFPFNPTCYLKNNDVKSCQSNILSQPWCYSDTNPAEETEYKIHYCNVKQCSDCMYGQGNGSFALYPGRKLPEYQGRSIATKKGVPCLQGVGWEDNVCRSTLKIKTKAMGSYHTVTRPTPHCYVTKPGAVTSKIKQVPDGNLELAECKLRQCTVRQVWFLFFNTFGDAFIEESNLKGIKIVLVRGRKEERIKFGAFGIHRPEGLTLGTSDYRLSSYVNNFQLIPRRPPGPLSEIVIRNIQSSYSGVYSVHYKFSEADPAVDQGVYKVNFELEVKEPTTFSLSPGAMGVCLDGEGKFRLMVQGHFDILDDSLEWFYGPSREKAITRVRPENTRFELTADAMGLLVKRVTTELWVMVKGRTYSGFPSATAKVAIKDQPLLKAITPTNQYASPGDEVIITIETDQLQKVTWVFDAMVIGSLPDDPDMGFQRVPRGQSLVTSLVIAGVKEHHYGGYKVSAVLNGCTSALTFYVKHISERPEEEEGPVMETGGDKSSEKPKPTQRSFNRTGIWCTDDLEPYAFFFSVDFPTEMTIGAFRNEPLSETSAVEVQHYTIGHSLDKKSWTNTTFKGKTKIPYIISGEDHSPLPVPITARHFRFYPEKLPGTVACMKVRLYGCRGKTLECDKTGNPVPTPLNLKLFVGAPLGASSLFALVGLLFWNQRKLRRELELEKKRRKRKKKRGNRRIGGSEDETSDDYKGKRVKKRARREDSRDERRRKRERRDERRRKRGAEDDRRKRAKEKKRQMYDKGLSSDARRWDSSDEIREKRKVKYQSSEDDKKQTKNNKEWNSGESSSEEYTKKDRRKKDESKRTRNYSSDEEFSARRQKWKGKRGRGNWRDICMARRRMIQG
ncbi:predicted protein [Nematostella vectensis]|uniref:Uncharacterized protein n=1 Tax=Nematostella vectensis TaxID=45351 RepID=A7RKI4_NEMVE|nr:predicted protein [Nematostella vectensis]|eukprot:XP_001639977.1 predicted protein [Nematostella vectensis]